MSNAPEAADAEATELPSLENLLSRTVRHHFGFVIEGDGQRCLTVWITDENGQYPMLQCDHKHFQEERPLAKRLNPAIEKLEQAINDCIDQDLIEEEVGEDE